MIDKEEIKTVAALKQEVSDFKLFTRESLTEIKNFIKEELKETNGKIETSNTLIATWKEESPKKDDLNKVTDRLSEVEDKQEKFAWYIGIAVGIGAVIMFVVDKSWSFIQEIKK